MALDMNTASQTIDKFFANWDQSSVSKRARVNYELTDDMRDLIFDLGQIFTSVAKDNVGFANTEALYPMKLNNNPYAKTEQIIFEPQIPEEVPAEGVAPITEYHMESRESRMVQYAMAVNWELMQLRTAQGKDLYMRSMMQVLLGARKTLMILAVRECELAGRTHIDFGTLALTNAEYDVYFKRAVQMFGIGNRYPKSALTGLHLIAARLEQKGYTARTVVMNPALKALFLTETAQLSDHDKGGERAVSRLLSNDPLSKFGLMNIYESPLENETRSQDFTTCCLDRFVQVGGYVLIDHSEFEDTTYSINQSAFTLLNRDTDDMEKISLKDMMEKCHAFTGPGGLINIGELAGKNTIRAVYDEAGVPFTDIETSAEGATKKTWLSDEPSTIDNFMKFFKAGNVPPFSFLVSRPYDGHWMSGVIVCDPGEELGVTFHSDFIYSKSEDNKNLTGSMRTTFNAKAQTRNADRTITQENFFFLREESNTGGNINFFSPSTHNDYVKGGTYKTGLSLLCFMVPFKPKLNPNDAGFIDVTGASSLPNDNGEHFGWAAENRNIWHLAQLVNFPTVPVTGRNNRVLYRATHYRFASDGTPIRKKGNGHFHGFDDADHGNVRKYGTHLFS